MEGSIGTHDNQFIRNVGEKKMKINDKKKMKNSPSHDGIIKS